MALLGAAASIQASVTLYRDAGFHGESETFAEDVADLEGSKLGNDAASSVRVRPGCVVTLYAEARFRGPRTELDRDEPRLEDAAVGDDRVSSLRIRCGVRGRGGQGPGVGKGVMLYGDEGFRGDGAWLEDDVPDLGPTRVGNDTASSLRAGPGCRVRLYEDAGYHGRHVELRGDVWSLSKTRLGDDRASSAQVRCAGDERGWGVAPPRDPDRSGGDPPPD